MKFSTGSSSSSLASDSLSRKSTLCIYTDSDFLNGHKEMDGQNEAAELRRELANVHRALMLQSDALARQQQRAGELELRLATQNAAAGKRLQARDQQLTTLVHALLILEAKLKSEQKRISLQFQAKNTQIYQQREQIKKLKQELTLKGPTCCVNCQNLIGSTSEQTNVETDPEFHSLESETQTKRTFERSLSYHEKQQQQQQQIFLKNSRLSKSFQLPKAEQNNRDNTSSSEEVFENSDACFSQSKSSTTYVKNKSAFVRKDVTRRSRKYSGRKHSSVYLETVQKRLNNKSRASSSSAEDGTQSEKDNAADIGKGVTDYDIGDEITKDIERASNRIDELLNASQTNSTPCFLNDSLVLRQQKLMRDVPLSRKIETLHGIRKRSTDERVPFPLDVRDKRETPWYTNNSDGEQDAESPYAIKREKINRYRCKSADDILVATFNDSSEIEPKMPPEFLPSIDAKNDDTESKYGNTTNKFDDATENWYASASDQDEDHSCGIYKNNPVLECVNQILLQNNLDESGSDNAKPQEMTSPKASTKRVQFSTLNSISFEEHVKREDNSSTKSVPRDVKPTERRGANKIVKFSLDTASEHSYEVPVSSEGFNYEVQSIYSNDYEPIITKPFVVSAVGYQKSKLKPIPSPRNVQNEPVKKSSLVKNMAMNLENRINGNHYVDMENNKFRSNKQAVPKVPPALPPKPKNLVSKFKLNHLSSVRNSAQTTDTNSDAVEFSQRISEVPKTKQDVVGGAAGRSSVGIEPDYCSISEVNAPVAGKGPILTQTTAEVHVEQFSSNIVERRPIAVSKMATISRITSPNKISDKDIPKLPQVTEIIIPDDDDDDNVKDQKPKPKLNGKVDARSSIQIGRSISTILSDIKNRNVSMDDVSKCILSVEQRSEPSQDDEETAENDSDKFDLSQNFEEFKIDECEFANLSTAEEYKISCSDDVSVECTDAAPADPKIKPDTTVVESNKMAEVKAHSKMLNKPDLLSNIENVETDSVRYSDLESSNSSSSNCGSYNTVKYEPISFPNAIITNVSQVNQNIGTVPFEYFLESTGLSSKSILTPSRPPNSNHKSVMKPKDVKMKSKHVTSLGRATPLHEKCSSTAIKYFEPYL